MTLNIPALRALCAAAEQEPWTNDCHSKRFVRTPSTFAASIECGSSDDAAFIAAARSALPLAIDRIEALQAALTEALDYWASWREDQLCSGDPLEHPRIAELRKLVTP